MLTPADDAGEDQGRAAAVAAAGLAEGAAEGAAARVAAGAAASAAAGAAALTSGPMTVNGHVEDDLAGPSGLGLEDGDCGERGDKAAGGETQEANGVSGNLHKKGEKNLKAGRQLGRTKNNEKLGQQQEEPVRRTRQRTAVTKG